MKEKGMGSSSPLHNVKGYSSSRPPVSIFVICLILCASATLAMGFFIQYADPILNPEVTGNWLKFLERLGSIDFCTSASAVIENANSDPIIRVIDGMASNSSEEVSLTVSASVHLVSELKKLPPGVVAISGEVKVGDWAVLHDTGKPIDSLKMTFVIPPDLTETSDKDACVILTVPPTFLPHSTRSSVCVPSYVNTTVTHVGTLAVINSNATDPDCGVGAFLKLNFDKKSEADFYLSKREKWDIYQRLLHFSYFFFAFAFGILCLALLRTRAYISVVPIDKMPLTL